MPCKPEVYAAKTVQSGIGFWPTLPVVKTIDDCGHAFRYLDPTFAIRRGAKKRICPAEIMDLSISVERGRMARAGPAVETM
jgi:hypothetical protein